jgi:hypothetical protein
MVFEISRETAEPNGTVYITAIIEDDPTQPFYRTDLHRYGEAGFRIKDE